MTRSLSLGLALLSSTLLGATHLRAQEPTDRAAQLAERRATALAKPVFQTLPWHTDFAAAKEQAAATGKLIFAYFTRSYSP